MEVKEEGKTEEPAKIVCKGHQQCDIDCKSFADGQRLRAEKRQQQQQKEASSQEIA